MSSLLRQLLAVLVVTIVSAGLVVSATKAAMALDCETTLLQTVSGDPDHSGHPAVAAELAPGHGAHGQPAQGGGDAEPLDCQIHACPSTSIAAGAAVMPSAEVGRSLRVTRAGSLVEPTVPEGLRRPPRG